VSEDIIRRLYAALDAGDGEAMTACYAPDARFEDPAFGELRGEQVGGMWRMLTSRATDLEVELRECSAASDSGTAHWVARYTFTATGRPVVNDVRARFRFADGSIADHRDEFNFRRWARQALGPAGLAVAILPPLRARVRARARGQLEEFLAQERRT
jgi:ketosteroid isomerase-like protein